MSGAKICLEMLGIKVQVTPEVACSANGALKKDFENASRSIVVLLQIPGH